MPYWTCDTKTRILEREARDDLKQTSGAQKVLLQRNFQFSYWLRARDQLMPLEPSDQYLSRPRPSDFRWSDLARLYALHVLHE